jgi:hypothetical protein
MHSTVGYHGGFTLCTDGFLPNQYLFPGLSNRTQILFWKQCAYLNYMVSQTLLQIGIVRCCSMSNKLFGEVLL